MSKQVTSDVYRPDDVLQSLPVWLDGAQRGDQEAMMLGLEQYYPLLVVHVRKTYLPHLWEDAMQEARMAFIDAVYAFDVSVGVHFGTYAKRIVWGRLSTWRRKMTRTAAMEQPDVVKVGDQGEVSRIEQLSTGSLPLDDRVMVEGWLSQLSARERLLALRLIEGWTIREVAAAERVSVETVKTWKKRARLKLKKDVP